MVEAALFSITPAHFNTLKTSLRRRLTLIVLSLLDPCSEIDFDAFALKTSTEDGSVPAFNPSDLVVSRVSSTNNEYPTFASVRRFFEIIIAPPKYPEAHFHAMLALLAVYVFLMFDGADLSRVILINLFMLFKKRKNAWVFKRRELAQEGFVILPHFETLWRLLVIPSSILIVVYIALMGQSDWERVLTIPFCIVIYFMVHLTGWGTLWSISVSALIVASSGRSISLRTHSTTPRNETTYPPFLVNLHFTVLPLIQTVFLTIFTSFAALWSTNILANSRGLLSYLDELERANFGLEGTELGDLLESSGVFDRGAYIMWGIENENWWAQRAWLTGGCFSAYSVLVAMIVLFVQTKEVYRRLFKRASNKEIKRKLIKQFVLSVLVLVLQLLMTVICFYRGVDAKSDALFMVFLYAFCITSLVSSIILMLKGIGGIEVIQEGKVNLEEEKDDSSITRHSRGTSSSLFCRGVSYCVSDSFSSTTTVGSFGTFNSASTTDSIDSISSNPSDPENKSVLLSAVKLTIPEERGAFGTPVPSPVVANFDLDFPQVTVDIHSGVAPRHEEVQFVSVVDNELMIPFEPASPYLPKVLIQPPMSGFSSPTGFDAYKDDCSEESGVTEGGRSSGNYSRHESYIDPTVLRMR